MDRNKATTLNRYDFATVALRKESVDRNCDLEPIKNPEAVALRKESVDRNFADDAHFVTVCESLSARRAWIEILSSKYAL